MRRPNPYMEKPKNSDHCIQDCSALYNVNQMQSLVDNAGSPIQICDFPTLEMHDCTTNTKLHQEKDESWPHSQGTKCICPHCNEHNQPHADAQDSHGWAGKNEIRSSCRAAIC